MTRVWCDKLNCLYNAYGVCQAKEIEVQGRGSIMEKVVCPDSEKRGGEAGPK